jgi:hypothetical protein
MKLPLALIVLLACACRKTAAPALAPSPAGGLAAAVRDARNAPACAKTVAQEWAAGRAVPLDAPGRFAVFYYPMSGAPPAEPTMATPAASAVVDAGGGSPAQCRAWPVVPKDLAGPYWPAGVEKLDDKDFDARSARLDALTEAVGAAYAARRPPTPADAALAAEYFGLFDSMAELPLRAHYYRLNPAFWEWVRAAGGRSLPKA